jgi:hypothetical protein
MLRIVASFALVVVAAVAGLFALMSGLGIDHTVDNSKAILAAFERASSQNPNHISNATYPVLATPIEDANCDDAKFQTGRSSAGDKILLTVWRGEWEECYSPVSKTSTLIVDSDGYSLLGRFWLDRIVCGLACLLSVCAASRIFARRSVPLFKRRPMP